MGNANVGSPGLGFTNWSVASVTTGHYGPTVSVTGHAYSVTGNHLGFRTVSVDFYLCPVKSPFFLSEIRVEKKKKSYRDYIKHWT